MKLTEEQLEILRRAIDHWGEPSQTRKAFEELQELQEALHDYALIKLDIAAACASSALKTAEHSEHELDKANYLMSQRQEHVAEEVADVYIMMRQLAMMFPGVQSQIDRKMKRLAVTLQQF